MDIDPAYQDRAELHIASYILKRFSGKSSLPLTIGLCGAQGSGKSTVSARLEQLLKGRGLKAVTLSIDDFYLSKSERQRLAEDLHPLFSTRGPPGTHDTILLQNTLQDLKQGQACIIPRFNKLSDDLRPQSEWTSVKSRPDIIILEGWCVGAIAQPKASLADPINELESKHDTRAIWRTLVNEELATRYADTFENLDMLVLLRAPSFSVVANWRFEQEKENLTLSSDYSNEAMSAKDVSKFVQYYERLTRWITLEMPYRADLTLQLDSHRRPIAIVQRQEQST